MDKEADVSMNYKRFESVELNFIGKCHETAKCLVV